MAAKRKSKKAGSAPPLRKKYIYYLVFGLAVLGVVRGKDAWRTLQKKTGAAPSASRAAVSSGGDAASAENSFDGKALLRAVELLSEVSLDATNQLTVVRYVITPRQNEETDPDGVLAWIPRITAVRRVGPSEYEAWADGQNFREGGILKCKENRALRVVYLDKNEVLLCADGDFDRPRPGVALPVDEIQVDDAGRLLMVDGSRKVYEGDHILFAGWDFEIQMIATDRFKTAVKPLGADEGLVQMFQFVL